ncbi:MFS transporter [Amycolatopsis taiwanensis]|uniref:MFS transporter n=1 Tax=Amycolatopsis taiwanensis TaxID=342230 RepID=UPI00047FD9EC|nr:MFS transporter [Amycolatopsis taiwanensis]
MTDGAPAATAHGPSGGKYHPIRIVVLIILLTEVFSFEFNMVMPGLPNVAAAFRTTAVSLAVSVPLLVSAVVVPLLAKWADIRGKKLTMLGGTGVFLVGNVLCALAPTYPVFLLGRGLTSFGMVGSVISYGLIRDLLPPKWVPIGIGGLGTGIGVGAVIGPLVGGTLTDSFGFRSVFWFMICYAGVIGALVLVFVPESRVRIRQRLDFVGATLLGIGVAALIYASIVPSARIVAGVLGILLIVLFVIVERRTDQPLVSMRLLARPALSMTLLNSGLVGFIVGAQGVLLPLLLRTPALPGRGGLGLSAIGYAVNFSLVMGTCSAVCGFLAGLVSKRSGARHALLVSTAGWTVPMVLLAAGVINDNWLVRLVALLMGIAQGFYYASTANLIIDAVPAKMQGISASMKYTVEQGIGSIAGAVAGAVIATDIVQVVPGTGAIVYGSTGFRIAFGLLAVAGALAVVVVLLMRHGRTPATGGAAPDSDPG